jgi:hypothetical protein
MLRGLLRLRHSPFTSVRVSCLSYYLVYVLFFLMLFLPVFVCFRRFYDWESCEQRRASRRLKDWICQNGYASSSSHGSTFTATDWAELGGSDL